MPECHCPENHSFLRMAIWLRGGLERWYFVLGGVAVGRGFEPQSDLELSFAKILINTTAEVALIDFSIIPLQLHLIYKSLFLAARMWTGLRLN
jgi:hypothetical protein